jgi:hypothetical protein
MVVREIVEYVLCHGRLCMITYLIL